MGFYGEMPQVLGVETKPSSVKMSNNLLWPLEPNDCVYTVNGIHMSSRERPCVIIEVLSGCDSQGTCSQQFTQMQGFAASPRFGAIFALLRAAEAIGMTYIDAR